MQPDVARASNARGLPSVGGDPTMVRMQFVRPRHLCRSHRCANEVSGASGIGAHMVHAWSHMVHTKCMCEAVELSNLVRHIISSLRFYFL